MDDELIITMSLDDPRAYAAQMDLEDGDNALFIDFQVLQFSGDLLISYWVEESDDGMKWQEKDRVDGVTVEAALTRSLTSSVLGGVLARAGFEIQDSGGGGGGPGAATIRVTLNTFRR